VSPDLYDVINARRDVREQFIGGEIDEDVLWRVLSAAHAAPSVGMSEPWDFILVRDRTLRASFRAHVVTERSAFAETLSDAQRELFSRIKIEGIEEAALGIVVTYDPMRAAPAVLGRHSIADTGLYSTCLAIENLWLAATAEGLGVGWVSFYREPFVRDLFGIPEHLRPVAWLCIGPVSELAKVPDLERHGWRHRHPLEDVVHQDRYTAPARSKI
jgi:5,6-dimethylbenzimidazole synthase